MTDVMLTASAVMILLLISAFCLSEGVRGLRTRPPSVWWIYAAMLLIGGAALALDLAICFYS